MYAGQTLYNHKAVYWKWGQWIVSMFPSVWLFAIGKKYPYHEGSAGLEYQLLLEYNIAEDISPVGGRCSALRIVQDEQNWLGVFQY